MIRFRYLPTFEDWRTFNRHVAAKQFRLVVVIAAFLVFSFLTLPFLQRSIGQEVSLWESYRGNAGVLIFPGVMIFILGAMHYGIHRRWKDAAELREEREFIFDDTGVAVAADNFSSKEAWQHLREADVARGIVLLRSGQNTFYYFPKRLVPDWDAFSSLVARQMKVTRRFRRG